MKFITLRLAAIYQVVSAIAFAVTSVSAWMSATSLSSAIAAVLCILNLIIGLALLRQYNWASYLGVANMALQVPAMNSQPFSYSYIGIGDLFVLAGFDRSSSSLSFGAWASVTPGTFFVSFGNQVQGAEFYFGLLAAALTAVLASDCRRRPPWNPSP